MTDMENAMNAGYTMKNEKVRFTVKSREYYDKHGQLFEKSGYWRKLT
ncbi:MAG: hypothetical protein ACI4D0_10285 [Lachnospira sp.]